MYTSFATTFNQRVAPQQAISPTVLFVRSAARLGVAAGLAGAAVNWYYYSAFANVVVEDQVPERTKWRLYEWSKRYTVEDGALAGAALGLSASIPMLLMRRPAIPRWTRCLGMANIGACTGVVGAHAYFQYTGERQKAYRRLDGLRKRRSLEFWPIFWNKELMSRLSPIMQHYVRHNGIWYTQLLPDDVFEQRDHVWTQLVEFENAATKPTNQVDTVEVQTVEQSHELPFYSEPIDYATDLKQIDVDSTKYKLEEMQVEKAMLLEEAEYLLCLNAQQRYEYCHMGAMDHDERQRRLREIHVVDIAYNRLRNAADALDIKIIQWRMSLRHKAAWEKPSGDDQVADWLPEPRWISFATHKPTFSTLEIVKMQRQVDAEVQQFEQGSMDAACSKDKRERWTKDAEDGRVILRASDHVLFRMEKASKTAGDHGPFPVEKLDSANEPTSTSEEVAGPAIEGMLVRKDVAEPPAGSLEPGKS